MSPAPAQLAAAFSALERRLLARRFASLDGRTRAALALLAATLAAFAYWRTRVPLDGVHRFHGPLAAAGVLGGVLAAFAMAAAFIAAARQARLLRSRAGPEWLALPLPAGAVLRHHAWEARLAAAVLLPPAAACWLAGFGLVPPAVLTLYALALPATWWAGAWAGARTAAWAAAPHAPRLGLATRALLADSLPARARPLPTPRWRREPAWRALARLDVLVTLRSSPSRGRALVALLGFALALIAWTSGAPPLLRRAQSFAAYTLAATAIGAWALGRAGDDPLPTLRSLPLGVADAWLARARVAVLALAAGAALAALAASALPAGARIGLVITWLPAGAAIAVLGLHYGLTLPARSATAESLYFSWLGVAVISSLMIPFLGWGILFAGLAHSALRLPRWWRPEAA